MYFHLTTLYSCIRTGHHYFLMQSVEYPESSTVSTFVLARRWRNKRNQRTNLYRSITKDELKLFAATATACVPSCDATSCVDAMFLWYTIRSSVATMRRNATQRIATQRTNGVSLLCGYSECHMC